MPITLKPELQAWLERQVKDGQLPSVEDGVERAVADMMAITEGDLAWAKGHVDAARADVQAGNVVPAAEVITRLRRRSAK